MDPDATVIAPRTISVILVISNKRERPELPLNFFILRVLKVTTNNQLKVCNIDVYLKFEDGVGFLQTVIFLYCENFFSKSFGYCIISTFQSDLI